MQGRKWIGTFGGLGMLPAMPGTFGSLAAALIFYFIWRFAPVVAGSVVIGMLVVAFALAAYVCPAVQRACDEKDPRQFVLDEVVGQWIALLFVPNLALLPSASALPAAGALSYVAMGFFLFRAFDVAKPWPIGQIELLPGWWGVL